MDKLGVSGYGNFIARIFDSVAFKASLFQIFQPLSYFDSSFHRAPVFLLNSVTTHNRRQRELRQ